MVSDATAIRCARTTNETTEFYQKSASSVFVVREHDQISRTYRDEKGHDDADTNAKPTDDQIT
jgi:hypothetical protein